jgi:iron complex outermembrane receptor protein
VAGLDLMQRGGFGVQGDVQMRGGTFDQVLILIDGVKISDPQTGHHLLNLPINLEDIDHVEILKGGNSRVLGQNAFAGAINFVTRKPQDKGGYIGVTSGDFNLLGGRIGNEFVDRKYSQLLSLSGNQSDGYRKNSDFKVGQVFYKGAFTDKKFAIDWSASSQSKKFGANGFYTSKFPLQYEETQTHLAHVRLTIPKLTGFQVLGYVRGNGDYFLLDRTNPPFYRNRHYSQVWGVSASYAMTHKNGTLSLGAESRYEGILSTNLGIRKRTVSSFFVEEKYTLGSHWVFVPGLNVTAISGFKPILFPGLDIGYYHGPMTWFLNAGRSYRVPTYTDMFYKSPTDLGDSLLKPESNYHGETGIKYQKSNFSAGLSVFYRSTTNQIDWQAATDSLNKPILPYRPMNLGNLMTYGIDLNGRMTFNGSIGKWIQSVRVGYTYLKTNQNLEAGNSSRYTFNYLVHQLIAQMDVKYGAKLSHSIIVRTQQRINQGNYTTLDSRLSYAFPFGYVYAEATNITGTNYYDFSGIPVAPRWFRVGLLVRIGN